jgi:hypothetical protein
MDQWKELIGKNFGEWTVLDKYIPGSTKMPKRNPKILCKCNCGTERYVRINSLIRGESTSCRCNRSRGPLDDKRCTKCKQWKPLTEFYRKTQAWDGYNSYCKSCEFKRDHEPERYYRKLESNRNWRKSHPQFVKSQTLNRYDGINETVYNEKLVQQKNVCEICGKTQKRKNYRLGVDHDHKTNKVRALLCNNCNTAIGLVYENINILENIITYLKKHKKVERKMNNVGALV